MVIGDNALWEVTHAKITKTKVLEDDISCGAVVWKDANSYNILVGNFQNQILVYTDTYTLLWAVKMDETPLRICIMEDSLLRGTMCILGDNGTVSLSFLGSDIPETEIEQLKDEIDLKQVDSEIQRYNNEIKNKGEKEVMVQNQQIETSAEGA